MVAVQEPVAAEEADIAFLTKLIQDLDELQILDYQLQRKVIPLL